jgi:hypothetical protein
MPLRTGSLGLGLPPSAWAVVASRGRRARSRVAGVGRRMLLVGLVDSFALVERAVIYAEREEQLAVILVFEWPVGCGAEAFEVGGFAVEQAYY